MLEFIIGVLSGICIEKKIEERQYFNNMTYEEFEEYLDFMDYQKGRIKMGWTALIITVISIAITALAIVDRICEYLEKKDKKEKKCQIF